MNLLNRHALVLDNISLADKIAKCKKRQLSHISLDELKSAAYLGLVEAANNYKQQENDCFPAYAVWRIIGSVKDYLRELSWGKRSNRVDMTHIEDDEFVSKNRPRNNFDEIIRSLPSNHKKVLKMYYEQGFKIKEIASQMNVHESRISQILTESKVRLHSLLINEYSEYCRSAA